MPNALDGANADALLMHAASDMMIAMNDFMIFVLMCVLMCNDVCMFSSGDAKEFSNEDIIPSVLNDARVLFGMICYRCVYPLYWVIMMSNYVATLTLPKNE